MTVRPSAPILFRCSDCGQPATVITEVNPEGGHGMRMHVVCDDCMRSGRWDNWKAAHWPDWPKMTAAPSSETMH